MFTKTTPAQFKTDLVADARRLADLPGKAGGKLVKPDFAFGPFKDYIVEGKMPSETELGELQRKWDDVATVTELLSTNGIAELVDVQFAAAKTVESADAKDKRGKGGKRDKRMSPQVAPATLVSPVACSYVFSFSAKPAAFIRTLNALESCERFITVDDFSFVRPSDVIAESLGGEEKKASETQASGRRGRRGRRGGDAVAAPVAEGGDGTEKAEGRNRIVTDPLLDAPMTVTMTVTVHDFRSLEEKPEEVKK